MANRPVSPKDSQPAKTILVVEDDNDLSMLVTKKLTAEGFKVVALQTGQAVLDYLKNSRPDLVLLDILLPDIDGISILQQISATEHTKKIPVIIFSNLSEVGSIEQVKAIGAYEYLIKAKTELNELVRRIKKQLNLK